MELADIDGIRAGKSESPGSESEVSELLRRAVELAFSVVPFGGGTQVHLGNPPLTADIVLRTGALVGIVEYEPDNMTVAVRAGTPLQDLQTVLLENNQFLALDPPQPEQATLGGIVSSNSSGPIRFRYGTVRDMLIGVRIVHPDGTCTKAGGKLVKNVTGYDMCKLYTGALGTLGILTELIFKVQPRSESMATVLIRYEDFSRALEASRGLLKSDLLPDAMEIWSRDAYLDLRAPDPGAGSPWILMLLFGEVEPAVRWQVERVRELTASAGGVIIGELGKDQSTPFWQAAGSARASSALGEQALVKCSVTAQQCASTAKKILETGERLQAGTSLYCHAGNHLIYGRFQWEAENTRPAEEIRTAFLSLRRHCAVAGGHMVVERVRPEVKAKLDVWGYDAPALEIMRRIKREFDPTNTLNPGRFVGGI